jgi:hypothetical protein
VWVDKKYGWLKKGNIHRDKNASAMGDDNIYTSSKKGNNPQRYIWEHKDLIYPKLDHEYEQSKHNQTPLELPQEDVDSSAQQLHYARGYQHKWFDG